MPTAHEIYVQLTPEQRRDVEVFQKRDASPSGSTWRIHRFDSLSYAIKCANVDACANERNFGPLRMMFDCESSFYQNVTRQTLADAINHPDHRITDAVNDMRNELINRLPVPPAQRRKRHRNQFAGSDLDPVLVAYRRVDAWDAMRRQASPAHSVRILLEPVANCKQDQHHLTYRGATATALCDALERAGVATSLDAFWALTGSGTRDPYNAVGCTLKVAGQPLDVDRMSIATAHLGFSRILAFSLITQRLVGLADPGLGYPIDAPADERALYDIIIPRQLTGRDHCLQWLQDTIQKFTTTRAA